MEVVFRRPFLLAQTIGKSCQGAISVQWWRVHRIMESEMFDDLLMPVIELSHHVSVKFHRCSLVTRLGGLEGSCMRNDLTLLNCSKLM